MPLVFRKWRFHLSGRSRLLLFCKVAHAIGLQKMVFPSFWALHASLSSHFAAGRTLTMAKFRQRVAQLLKSYEEVRQNQKYSFRHASPAAAQP